MALGRATARKIHKRIGDEVNVTWSTEAGTKTLRLRVVGIVVVNDPISSQAGAGSGMFVTVPVFIKINGPNCRGPVGRDQARSAP